MEYFFVGFRIIAENKVCGEQKFGIQFVNEVGSLRWSSSIADHQYDVSGLTVCVCPFFFSGVSFRVGSDWLLLAALFLWIQHVEWAAEPFGEKTLWLAVPLQKYSPYR